MKKRIVIGICMLMWSGQALAACLGTITATTPTIDFVDNNNGTVTHTKTGLMWKQCSEGLTGVGCAAGSVTLHTWQAALQLAQTLNAGTGFAGFTDWRVPNKKELVSIIERQCANPAINTAIFPNTALNFWTSTPIAIGSLGNKAWFINFNNGIGNGGIVKTGTSHVRLVRGTGSLF